MHVVKSYIVIIIQVYFPQLAAAFEVFVCTSTNEDYIVRQDFLHQMLKLLKNYNCQALECSVYLHALKEYKQWACSSRQSSGNLACIVHLNATVKAV